MIILSISDHINYTFLFKFAWRMYFLSLGVKGLLFQARGVTPVARWAVFASLYLWYRGCKLIPGFLFWDVRCVTFLTCAAVKVLYVKIDVVSSAFSECLYQSRAFESNHTLNPSHTWGAM